MKKLLVIALAVVLTLSFAVVASAAALDAYVGGRLTWSYVDSDAREDDPVGYGNSGIKMLLKGKVSDEATGTWGALGAKIDGWPDGNKALNTSSIYEFGIDGVGGSNINLWYSNFENEKGNRGQGRIYNVDPLQSHDDCMFDRDLTNNVIGVDYVTDNVVVNFGYEPNKNVAFDKNVMSIAGTFKFDGGNVHVGYWDNVLGYDTDGDASTPNTDYEATEMNIGAEMKLGFGTVKVDFLALDVTEDATGVDSAYEGGSIIQAGVSLDDLKLDVAVAMDDKYVFANDGGMIYQIKYSPIDNLTFCYRAAQAKEDVDEQANFTNLYVGYKYGVIESRVGMATKGEDNDAAGIEQQDMVYASCYVSFW